MAAVILFYIVLGVFIFLIVMGNLNISNTKSKKKSKSTNYEVKRTIETPKIKPQSININPIIEEKTIPNKNFTTPKVDERKIKEINIKYNFKPWKNKIINMLDNSYSLSDLIILKDPNEIYYGDLLNCFEWKYKKLKIQLKNKYECQDCKIKSEFLHIHHEYYLQDKLPWEIENDGLTSLCHACHKKRHEKGEIPVYKETYNSRILVSYEKLICSRCGGTAYLPHYKHVEGGICFKCRGNLLNKTVFSTIIKITYNNLNNYNDNLKRIEYRDYIHKLDNYYLYETLPEIWNYEEDLPF